MPDILDLIRLKNIFSGPMNGPPANDLPEQGGFGGNLGRETFNPHVGMPGYPDREMFPLPPMRADSIPVLSNDYNPEARMAALYHPDHTYEDMYQKTLGEMPQRNKPGIVRKIFGAMAGMGGRAEDVDRTLYAPYYRNLADWDAKIKAIQPGLQYERYGNTANLSSARDVIRSEASERRADDRYKMFEESEKRKSDYGNRNLAIREAKNRLDQWKQEHPDWDIKEVKGGNIIAFNPKNPSEQIDTGIGSGEATDLEKAKWALQRTIAGARETGAQARQTEGVRQAGRMSLAEYRAAHPDFKIVTDKDGRVLAIDPKDPDRVISTGIEQLSKEDEIDLKKNAQIEVKKTESGSKTAGGMLPTQQRIDLVNRANRLLIQHPEWKGYVTIDKNDVSVKKPWFGNDEILKQVQKELGTGTSNSQTGRETSVKTETTTVNNPPKPEELVEVTNPQGKRVRIRKSQLADALTRGYKQ